MKKIGSVLFFGLHFISSAFATPTNLSDIADAADEAFIAVVRYASSDPYFSQLDLFGVRGGQPVKSAQSAHNFEAYVMNLKTLKHDEDVNIVKGQSVYAEHVVDVLPRAFLGGTIDSACLALKLFAEKDSGSSNHQVYTYLCLKGVNKDPGFESNELTHFCTYNVARSVFIDCAPLAKGVVSRTLCLFSDTHRSLPFRGPRNYKLNWEYLSFYPYLTQCHKNNLDCYWVDFYHLDRVQGTSAQSLAQSIEAQTGIALNTRDYTIKSRPVPVPATHNAFKALNPIEQLYIACHHSQFRSVMPYHALVVENGEWIVPQSAQNLPPYNISPLDNQSVSFDELITCMDNLPKVLLTLRFRKQDGTLSEPFYMEQIILQGRMMQTSSSSRRCGWFVLLLEVDPNTARAPSSAKSALFGPLWTMESTVSGQTQRVFPKRFDLILRTMMQDFFSNPFSSQLSQSTSTSATSAAPSSSTSMSSSSFMGGGGASSSSASAVPSSNSLQSAPNTFGTILSQKMSQAVHGECEKLFKNGGGPVVERLKTSINQNLSKAIHDTLARMFPRSIHPSGPQNHPVANANLGAPPSASMTTSSATTIQNNTSLASSSTASSGLSSLPNVSLLASRSTSASTTPMPSSMPSISPSSPSVVSAPKRRALSPTAASEHTADLGVNDGSSGLNKSVDPKTSFLQMPVTQTRDASTRTTSHNLPDIPPPPIPLDAELLGGQFLLNSSPPSKTPPPPPSSPPQNEQNPSHDQRSPH